MLPKNKLRQPRLRRLKVFKTDKHIYNNKFKKNNNLKIKKDAKKS